MPTIVGRVLAERWTTSRHRQIDHFGGITEARVESLSRDPRGDRQRPFPVQVDGDYIGDHTELELEIEPGALSVVA
jgi:diacylglycerol kinase family enzyme